MLAIARARHPDLPFVIGDALSLPFADNDFDAVTISFGLRNVADPERALAEMARVTRPGGRLVVCEFSVPSARLPRALFRWYLRHVVPVVAATISSNPQAYQYLADSVQAWLRPENLSELIREAGWQDVRWQGLDGGIVTLHTATAPQPGRFDRKDLQMLASVDEVDWPTLVSGVGRATDVPARLRQLTRTDEVTSVGILHALLDELWVDTEVFPATAAAIPFLCELLSPPVTWLHPKIALILGVLAEGRSDDLVIQETVHTAVESGLDAYLGLLQTSDRSVAMELSLLYLLAHFPQHRSRIYDEIDPHRWNEDDMGRLDRCLTTPDFSDPATLAVIGRAWPTPAIWRLDDGETLVDHEWKESLDLDPEEAQRIWALETKAVLAYLGAQAEHAVKEASGVR
jgi:SAM-dependent methyltransferase